MMRVKDRDRKMMRRKGFRDDRRVQEKEDEQKYRKRGNREKNS